MKVIRVNNFDDEGPAGTEWVLKDNLTGPEAFQLAKDMNGDPKRTPFDWFLAVPDDYKLYVFEP